MNKKEKALVEKWAIQIALGNNGGTWAEHYQEQQKQVWRDRVIGLIKDIKETGINL